MVELNWVGDIKGWSSRLATGTTELFPVALDGAAISDGFERLLARAASVLPGRFLRKAAELALAISEPTRYALFRPQPVEPAVRKCGEIKVLSSNLLHDFPKFRNGEERLERFVKLVEDVQPDIILAQELYRTPALQSDQWLADRLGMAYTYARANGSLRVGFEEGVGIFSRFELGFPFVHQMSGGIGPVTRRLALGSSVSTPCGDIHVFSLHLSLLPLANRFQLRHLPQWINKIVQGGSFLVGGDFNTNERAGHIRPFIEHWVDTFRKVHPDEDATTYEVRWPLGKMHKARLDYIFLGQGPPNWEVIDTQHLVNPYGPHSDHYVVLTRLAPARFE